jgi:hypothetical protein
MFVVQQRHMFCFLIPLFLMLFSLYMWYIQTCGSFSVVSKNDFGYYVHFIDEFSKFSWIYFLHFKNELVDVLIKLKCQVENLFCSTIKILQTNGGTEFKSLPRFLPQILHQVSCPYMIHPSTKWGCRAKTSLCLGT